MSRVTFHPKEGTEYIDGWPEKVVGDGFIDLELEDSELKGDCAVYSDQFGELYDFSGRADGLWTVEVRED